MNGSMLRCRVSGTPYATPRAKSDRARQSWHELRRVSPKLIERAPGRVERLLPRELRRAPGVVGGDAFLRVLALEEALLQLALEGEALLEPDLDASGDCALDQPDGARGFRWRDELARVFERSGAEVARRHVEDGIDQPE